MFIYFDSVIVIYLLDHTGSFNVRAMARLRALQAAGERGRPGSASGEFSLLMGGCGAPTLEGAIAGLGHRGEFSHPLQSGESRLAHFIRSLLARGLFPCYNGSGKTPG